MRHFWMTVLMVCFLAFGAGSYNMVTAQYDYEYETLVPDTLSIDDMDPILYGDDDYVIDEERGNTGLIIGVIIVAIAIGLVVYKVVAKRKE